MVPNDKKFFLSLSISQELYIIWLSFMLHMCKMIISPGVFSFFSKFWFFRLLGSKRPKNGPKWQKNSVCCTPYLKNHTSFDYHLWYTFVKWWYLQVFFFFSFFKVFIFWDHQGGWRGLVKGQKITQNDCLTVSLTLYLRNHTSHIVIFDTHV